MQVVNDGRAAQVKEVLAPAAITGPLALPVPDVSASVLDGDPLAQLRPAGRGLLPLAQLVEEAFVGMDGDAAPLSALRAAAAKIWPEKGG